MAQYGVYPALEYSRVEILLASFQFRIALNIAEQVKLSRRAAARKVEEKLKFSHIPQIDKEDK